MTNKALRHESIEDPPLAVVSRVIMAHRPTSQTPHQTGDPFANDLELSPC